MTFSIHSRQKWLNDLDKNEYDLVIIGGGITGAGIALQASKQGLKTLILDKNDFGSGTSSQSSKLVHGGLRYLQQFHFGLVHTALRERYYLLNYAPHLIKRLPFVLPIYNDSPDGYIKLNAGLYFYDFLCGLKNIGWHKMIGRKKLKTKVPGLKTEGLKAAANYYDAQGDDAKLVLTSILTAVENGVHAINYLEVTSFKEENGEIVGISAIDDLEKTNYKIKAKIFINATGAWSDQVRRAANKKTVEDRLRNTKGIHVVVPHDRCPIKEAVMIFSKIDKRAMFALPWENVTLLGTTDDDYNDSIDNINATKKEVAYILESFNYAFPENKLITDDIISTMAGVRPLALKKGIHASEVSREHDIFEGPTNMLTIIGGKLTTYFKMADDILKKIKKKKILVFKKIKNLNRSLKGSQSDLTILREQILKADIIDSSLIEPLIKRYGTEISVLEAIIKKEERLKERIHPALDYIMAEIDYCIEHEMVIKLSDFMLRRTRLFYLDKKHSLHISEKVIQRMSLKLNWSEKEIQLQREQYLALCKNNDQYK